MNLDPRPSAPVRPRRWRRSKQTTKETPEAVELEIKPLEVEADTTEETPAQTTEHRRPRRRRRSRGAPQEAPETAPAVEATAQAPAQITTTPTVAPDYKNLEALLSKQTSVLTSGFAKQLTALNAVHHSLTSLRDEVSHLEEPNKLRSRPKVGVFVDVPNVYYAAERLGSPLDYRRLLEFLSRDRELVRASAYAPISEDTREHARLEAQKFVQPFVGKGYKIITKPLKRFADGSVKANFDVELAIDILTMSDRLDIVSLVSGDGDFCRLVELVASKGVRVEIAAFGFSTSFELRAVADKYVDLEQYLDELKV